MRVTTIFDIVESTPLYSQVISNALMRIFPHNVSWDEKLLPLVKWQKWANNPDYVSISLLCPHRQNVGKFFYEMVSRWLIPGKKLNVCFFFSTDFKIAQKEETLYTLSEIVIRDEDMEAIDRNLPIIESEIRLGTLSVYHASRILEIKGLSADEKTTLIQEKISTLVQKRPKEFDYDIFGEMQHFLVMCHEEFKATREYHHMSRIIYVLYLFRKSLRMQVEQSPAKRYLSLKLVKARLHHPFGVKKVLALFVGVNFIKDNELFQEKHLVKAFQVYIPNAHAVEGSFFAGGSRGDRIHTLYIEMEKEDGADFSLSEIAQLRKGLKEDLKGSIEHWMRPIFMPRNEEEVMRNVVTLSHQLKYVRDIPQVNISFDEQTESELAFTVIVVRILHDDPIPLMELFAKMHSPLKMSLEKVKRVGSIRNKYPKEATIFSVRLQAGPFLRSDHSVDLFKARQELTSELARVMGEVRDFNGGMISKQVELFLSLKNLLGEIAERHELLLENFFHSITPMELRSLVDPKPLKTLFLMILDLLTGKETRLFIRESDKLFIAVAIQDMGLKQTFHDSLVDLELPNLELMQVHLDLFDTHYIGFILFSENEEKQHRLMSALDNTLATY